LRSIRRPRLHVAALLCTAIALGASPAWGAGPSDPLPSWRNTPTRKAIVSFVEAVTDPEGPRFVPPDERVVVFDQDGTLWVEHPVYTQIEFVLDRFHQLAEEQHPEWKFQEPFRSVLEGDLTAITRLDPAERKEILDLTSTGMSSAEYARLVSDWIATARHPRFDRPYTELVYEPMRELVSWLGSRGFVVWIVTGASADFTRVYAEKTFGVPRERVVGSDPALRYEERPDGPILLREPKIFFVNDRDGKPIGIHRHIGRRPIAAFGNSEGDREMLRWTTAASGLRFGALVLHDDAEDAYAYGPAEGLPATDVGAFPQRLYDEAMERGWEVIRMKEDWKRVFSWQEPTQAPAAAAAPAGKVR